MGEEGRVGHTPIAHISSTASWALQTLSTITMYGVLLRTYIGSSSFIFLLVACRRLAASLPCRLALPFSSAVSPGVAQFPNHICGWPWLLGQTSHVLVLWQCLTVVPVETASFPPGLLLSRNYLHYAGGGDSSYLPNRVIDSTFISIAWVIQPIRPHSSRYVGLQHAFGMCSRKLFEGIHSINQDERHGILELFYNWARSIRRGVTT
jgi:hypothetical protein